MAGEREDVAAAEEKDRVRIVMKEVKRTTPRMEQQEIVHVSA